MKKIFYYIIALTIVCCYSTPEFQTGGARF